MSLYYMLFYCSLFYISFANNFLLEFKMDGKIAEVFLIYNNAFNPGTANEYMVNSCSRDFA